MVQTVKCLPTMWETWVQSLGWEDPLEKEMATHSSILAWKTPWTEEPGRLQSVHRITKSQTRLSDFTFKLISQKVVPVPTDNCLFFIFYNYLQTQTLQYLLFFSSSFMHVMLSPFTGKPMTQLPSSVDSASTLPFSQAL